MTVDLRASVLLAAQRALWDLVTPNLRGVAVLVTPSRVVARFVFEDNPSELDEENVSEAETELMADVPFGVEVMAVAEASPPPRQRVLRPGEEWVYLRQERGLPPRHPTPLPATSVTCCRVCGYESAHPPWGATGGDPSWDVCPCCGVEHGYEDVSPETARRYRRRWVGAGTPWSDPRTPHDGLDLDERGAHVPKEFR
jgi:hypothetical protein